MQTMMAMNKPKVSSRAVKVSCMAWGAAMGCETAV
jgi:hypothetical protein